MIRSSVSLNSVDTRISPPLTFILFRSFSGTCICEERGETSSMDAIQSRCVVGNVQPVHKSIDLCTVIRHLEVEHSCCKIGRREKFLRQVMLKVACYCRMIDSLYTRILTNARASFATFSHWVLILSPAV